MLCGALPRRHHSLHALRCRLLLAVVRLQISSPPSAHSATTGPLDVAQNFFGLEAINRQRALMVTGPVAFALAEPIGRAVQRLAWPFLRTLFTQSWSGPKPLLLIALALMLVHSPREKLEAMWAHRLLR